VLGRHYAPSSEGPIELIKRGGDMGRYHFSTLRRRRASDRGGLGGWVKEALGRSRSSGSRENEGNASESSTSREKEKSRGTGQKNGAMGEKKDSRQNKAGNKAR